MTAKPNTKIELLYRDASNYKQFDEVVLEGQLTDQQIANIKEHLHDGEALIAREVGLPTPSEKNAEQGYNFPTDDDHVFTTLCAFEDDTPKAEDLYTDEPHTPGLTALGFACAVATAPFDIGAEMERMGF